MPWVRIDENAMEHRKILVLSAEAFRLWVRGLAHCQKHLTDGLILKNDLKAIRGVTSARVSELTTPVSAGEAALWEAHEAGFMVHDYLIWNDSKEHVLRARQFAKERIKRLRDKKSSNAVRNGVANDEQPKNETCTSLSGVVCKEEGRGFEETEEGPGETALIKRASAFTLWYSNTHERLFGVGYMGTNMDWGKAIELCRKFSDSQLRDGSLVWFGMDDDFAVKGTRTIVKFATRITDCLLTIKARGIA